MAELRAVFDLEYDGENNQLLHLAPLTLRLIGLQIEVQALEREFTD